RPVPCFDENQLLEFVEGGLSPAERSGVESHVLACSDCRVVLAALAAHEPGVVTQPGDRVGRYVLGPRIGSGGMGVVHVAHDPELDRRVAIKLLNPAIAATRNAREWLAREARSMAQIAHP